MISTFHIFSIFSLYWPSLLKNNLIFQKIYPTNVSKNATVNTFTQRGNICILPKLANASASFFKNLYPVSSRILSSVFFKVLKQEVINNIYQNYIPLLLFISVQTQNLFVDNGDRNCDRTCNNEQDWTPVKYLNVLHHNRTQSSCNNFS